MKEEIKDYTVLLETESDPRDYKIAKFVPGTHKIEDVEFMLDLPEIEIVLNQTGGSCVGHAFAMAKSICEYQHTHKWIDFDPYVIYGTRYAGEYTGRGMYLRQGAKVLYKEGAFFRRDFDIRGEMPYIQDEVKDFKKSNTSLVEQAKKYCIEGYAFIDSDNVDEMKTALKNGMPLVISIDVTAGIGVPDGVVKKSDKIGPKTERHAVCVVGWRTIDNHPYWIIINSWGNKSGYNGLLFYDVDRKINEVISVSDTITPSTKKCEKIEFVIGSSSFLADGETKTFETVPYIKNDRVYLPIRFVAENLGASVEWDAKTGVATIRSEEAIIVITNKSKKIVVTKEDPETSYMDVAPEISNDRMMAPIRFLAEALNCKVEWIAKENKAVIAAL